MYPHSTHVLQMVGLWELEYYLAYWKLGAASTKYHDGEHYNMDILLGEMMKALTQLILIMYRPIRCSSTSLTCILNVVHEWISLSGFHRKYIVQRCRCRKHVFHFRCQDDIVFFYVFHKKSMNYRHRNDVRVSAGRNHNLVRPLFLIYWLY